MPETDGAERGAGPLCLVADVSTTARRIVRAVLEAAGPVVVLEARSATEAREALDLSPAFVFVDRALPGTPELAFVAEARARAETAGCRIVVLSFRRDAAAAREARAAGADAVVLKPLDPVALSARWATLVAGADSPDAEPGSAESAGDPESKAA